MSALARKNNLGKHLMRMRKKFSLDYDFFPETWMLPYDSQLLKQQFVQGDTLIVKPEASC
jgi:tubulin polyglutamylase TTLL6/13